MPNKKQAAKKRIYVKKSEKWSKKDHDKAIHNLEFLEPPKPIVKKDIELEELTTLCSIMDNLTDEQKQRFLKFLCGRYFNFM